MSTVSRIREHTCLNFLHYVFILRVNCNVYRRFVHTVIPWTCTYVRVCGYVARIFRRVSKFHSVIRNINISYSTVRSIHTWHTSGVDDIAQLCPFLLRRLKVLGRRHNLNIKNDTVPIKRGSSVAERST